MDMTLVTPNSTDAVSVSAIEWGLIGRRLLSAMSGETRLVSPSEAGEEGRERRKLKNEDSSYGSDLEPSHEDVSRTASETLAAEFEDYVTTFPVTTTTASSGVTNQQQPPVIIKRALAPSSKPALVLTTNTAHSSTDEETLTSVIESAEYPRQVEFGVKLGYSESLVQLALTKLGPNPDKNELLDELIRLGAGAPKTDCEEEQQQPEGEEPEKPQSLRHVIIDGSNVAMSHGNKTKFACKGIRLCVEWFQARGHKEITVLVPMWRKEPSRIDSPISDQDVLQELEEECILFFTPSRSCGGKRIVSYDDRYIIKEALTCEGVIVSNDNYRDLKNESAAFKRIIDTSLLMYSWVNGRFEPPDDPLGRNGPSLDAFLRKGGPSSSTAKDSRPCPYGRKCTYGNKCKYMHPERGAAPIKSVTEILQEQKQKHYQDKAKSRDSSPGDVLRAKSLSLPTSVSEPMKKPLARTQSSFPVISQASKEATISEFPLTSADLSFHTPVTSHNSVDSLCSPLRQGDPNLYSLCSPHCPQVSQSLTWSDSASSNARLTKPSLLEQEENLHPKLQRQLSINPGGDDRLSKMIKHFPSMMSIQQQQQQQLLHQQMMNQQHRQGEGLNTRCISPGFTYSNVQSYMHPPITRHSSSQEQAFSMLSTHFHNPVSRNLSAPDPPIKGPSSAHITRMNSTSDPRLNVYSDSQQFLPDCFDDKQMRHSFHHHPIGISNSSPGPIGSRPMSPQQPLTSLLQQQPPSHSGPRHLSQTLSTGNNEDERLKIFYHLSQLFPEAKVRAALARNPDETDPTKICMSIVGLSNAAAARPPSPVRVQPSYSPMMATAAGGLDTTRESARLEAYSALSKLFAEDQVRNLLLRYPEETDPTKLCMLLMALNNSQQS